MKPSAALHANRGRLRTLLETQCVDNVRIFGSAVAGTDTESSDLDVLIDPRPETTLFDLSLLQQAMEALLGVPVDLRTPSELPIAFRDQVLASAQPL